MNLEFIKTIDLFENMSDEDLHDILAVCHLEAYEPDQVIFKQGEEADRFYIVKKGSVRITKHIEGVGEEVLGVIHERDYFGEMALIDDNERSARATAIVSTDVVCIYKKDLRVLLKTHLQLANCLMWTFCCILSKRLRGLHEKLEDMFTMTRFY